MRTSIEHAAGLRIGEITSVSPIRFEAKLTLEAPRGMALNTGEPVLFPKINAFVLIPCDGTVIVGQITHLGSRLEKFGKDFGSDPALVPLGQQLRFLEITPIGTLKRKSLVNDEERLELERGVECFPSIGDAINLPSNQQLKSIVESSDENDRLHLGDAVHAQGAKVRVNPDKIFGRHLAVLGNTGSGKSCSVANLIRKSIMTAKAARKGAAPNTRFIVLDPNGEYSKAFKDLPGCLLLKPDPEAGDTPFVLPAWMWNSKEWFAFARAQPGAQQPMLLKALRDLRSGVIAPQSDPALLASKILRGFYQLLSNAITNADYAAFPKSGNVHKLLRSIEQQFESYPTDAAEADKIAELVSMVRGAYEAQTRTSGTREYRDPFELAPLQEIRNHIETISLDGGIVTESDASLEDIPKSFDVRGLPDYLDTLSLSDEFARSAEFVGFMRNRIKYTLLSERLRPITAPDAGGNSVDEWLTQVIGGNDESKLVVVDLSLVSADVIHLLTSVFARLILESLQRHRKMHKTELPTVLVVEEAHNFIIRSRGEDNFPEPRTMCRDIFEKIAREGRKFGLGLVISSQRPSELSPTVLAQCNTFILHRLVNDEDQTLVRRLVPDTMGGLMRELSNLPSRQAILLGWATPIPVLTEMPFLPKDQRPHSEDPKFWDAWTGATDLKVDWRNVVRSWVGED